MNQPWSQGVSDLESDESRDDEALDEGGGDEVEEDGQDKEPHGEGLEVLEKKKENF